MHFKCRPTKPPIWRYVPVKLLVWIQYYGNGTRCCIYLHRAPQILTSLFYKSTITFFTTRRNHNGLRNIGHVFSDVLATKQLCLVAAPYRYLVFACVERRFRCDNLRCMQTLGRV